MRRRLGRLFDTTWWWPWYGVCLVMGFPMTALMVYRENLGATAFFVFWTGFAGWMFVSNRRDWYDLYSDDRLNYREGFRQRRARRRKERWNRRHWLDDRVGLHPRTKQDPSR